MQKIKPKRIIVGLSTLAILSSPFIGFATISILDKKTSNKTYEPTFLDVEKTKVKFWNSYNQQKSKTDNFLDFANSLQQKISEENNQVKMQKQINKMSLESDLDSTEITEKDIIEKLTTSPIDPEDYNDQELQKIAIEEAMSTFDLTALQASGDFNEIPDEVDINQVMDSYLQTINEQAQVQFEQSKEMLETIQNANNEISDNGELNSDDSTQSFQVTTLSKVSYPKKTKTINSKINNIQTGDFFYQKDVDDPEGNIVGHSGIIKKFNNNQYQIIDSWIGDGVRVGAFKKRKNDSLTYYFSEGEYMSKQKLNDFIKNQKVTVMRAQKLQWRRTWWIFGWWFWTDLSYSKRVQTWDEANKYVNRPYDNYFHSPYGIYCSELVNLAYKKVGVNLDFSHFYTGGLYTRDQIGKYFNGFIGNYDVVDTFISILISKLSYTPFIWPIIAAFTFDIVFPRELYLDPNSRIVYNYNDAS